MVTDSGPRGMLQSVVRNATSLFAGARLKIGTGDVSVVTHRSEGSDAAILLVHGFGMSVRTWGALPSLLEGETALEGWDLYSVGYDTGFSPDLRGIWSADPDIATLSTYIRSRLRLAPLNGYRALALVAHSMGGLVVQRALIDDPRLVGRTSHVVLYGTPSSGLQKARIGSFLKAQIKDMAIGSTFLEDLRSRWEREFAAHRPFGFWTVAGDRDVFVPASSSLGPFPIDTQVVVPGNHVEIARPEQPDDMTVTVLVDALTGGGPPGGPFNAARVAVEGRDFHQAVDLLLPRAAELDDRHLVELALALDETGRRHEAVAVLRDHARTTDALGTLAGRLKRVWMAEGLRREAEEAIGLYRQAHDTAVETGNPTQAAYHAINLAFLELAYRNDADAARAFAREAIEDCASTPQDQWRAATLAEAHLYLGETDAALAEYRRAIERATTPREVESMWAQASRVAAELDDSALAARLDDLFGHGTATGAAPSDG